jgi:hypothetical protein
MSAVNPVPADVEPDTMIDLVQDCREISGTLGAFVPTVVRIPDARGAAPDGAFGAMPVEISAGAIDTLAGLSDYGS